MSSSSPSAPPTAPAAAAAATLWSGGYAAFLVNVGAATLAIQILNTVIGYQMYELTGDPLALGLVGLAEALPFLALVLLGGHAADRFDRRLLSAVAMAVMVVIALALLTLSRQADTIGRGPLRVAIYALIVAVGVSRSVIQPARAALSQQLVPRAFYARAVALRTGVFQVAAVAGPAVGGLAYGLGGAPAGHAAAAALFAVALVALVRLRVAARPAPASRPALMASLGEGIRFIRSDHVLRGAMLLDLLAVLFGGAVALLPVFAHEILQVGPRGFGVLRAAPAIGALAASLALALRPPLRRAGVALLIAVAGFGAAMIGFALSRSFALSLVLLAASGAFDMISILVRSTLLQLRVPEAMMGRVAAINQVFIGSSNEIGAFESGVAARLVGVVPSVVAGGAITMAVAAWAAARWKDLRRLGPLAG